MLHQQFFPVPFPKTLSEWWVGLFVDFERWRWKLAFFSIFWVWELETNLWQYQMSKRDWKNSFATEPTIGNNANEVEWWHWVKNGDKHLQSVFLFTIFSKWDPSYILCSQFIHLQLADIGNSIFASTWCITEYIIVWYSMCATFSSTTYSIIVLDFKF